MLFTIYGDLREIHTYRGKTLIAEKSANMKNCIFYLSCSSSFEPFRAVSLHFMKNARHLELQISQITPDRYY